MEQDSEPEPLLCWTIKIAGVSGSGKTTLLNMIEQSYTLGCTTITYSSFLQRYGTKELADNQVKQVLANSKGLVLMDEHLEFENPQRATNYIRENTRGLIILEPPLNDILERIKADTNKLRKIDAQQILPDLAMSKLRGLEIAELTGIQLLFLTNGNGDLEETVQKTIQFIERIQ